MLTGQDVVGQTHRADAASRGLPRHSVPAQTEQSSNHSNLFERLNCGWMDSHSF